MCLSREWRCCVVVRSDATLRIFQLRTGSRTFRPDLGQTDHPQTVADFRLGKTSRDWFITIQMVFGMQNPEGSVDSGEANAYICRAMNSTALNEIIARYRANPESVYNTWFTNNDSRLKAFRSIRRGVRQVVTDIREKSFGNDFKGSSLEFVLTCITEQKEVFEGAAHPFYWKPKLRIPEVH